NRQPRIRAPTYFALCKVRLPRGRHCGVKSRMSRRKRLAFPAASISLSGLRPKGAGRLSAAGIGDIAGADHAGKRHARALVEEVLDAMTGKFEALYFACGPPLDPARAI